VPASDAPTGHDAGGRARGLPAFLAPLVARLEDADPSELDARLRRAVRLEQRLDAEIASLLHQVTSAEYAWPTRRPTLAELASDRLGMSIRKARALLRVERQAAACPGLHAAWRDGTLSWVQAQTLAPLLLDPLAAGGSPEPPFEAGAVGTDWRTAWLRFASQVTVRRLDDVVGRALALHEADPEAWAAHRDDPEQTALHSAGREVGLTALADAVSTALDPAAGSAAEGRRQTCARDRGVLGCIRLRITAPRAVTRLFRAALCSTRRLLEAQTGRLPPEEEAFEAMIDHALRTWGVDDPWLADRSRAARQASRGGVGRMRAVLERDGWRCTIPGCTSQRNLHVHHLRFRSAGGSDALGNLTTLCAAHHQRGVHGGIVRVGGEAPDALWFELGVRPGRPPFARYVSGDRVA